MPAATEPTYKIVDGNTGGETSSAIAWRPPVVLINNTQTTLPTGTGYSFGNYSVQNGERVLFTNLSNASQNNRIYQMSGDGVAISWTLATDGLAGDGSPTRGDYVDITQGSGAAPIYKYGFAQYIDGAWTSALTIGQTTVSASGDTTTFNTGSSTEILSNQDGNWSTYRGQYLEFHGLTSNPYFQRAGSRDSQNSSGTTPLVVTLLGNGAYLGSSDRAILCNLTILATRTDTSGDFWAEERTYNGHWSGSALTISHTNVIGTSYKTAGATNWTATLGSDFGITVVGDTGQTVRWAITREIYQHGN